MQKVFGGGGCVWRVCAGKFLESLFQVLELGNYSAFLRDHYRESSVLW
jgi:hypothetical protein